MKTAFTLLELIFVVVLIGIIAAIGSSFYRTDYLNNDTLYVAGQIKNAHYTGLGYSRGVFGDQNATAATASTIGCIELSADGLRSDATDAGARYALHATLSGPLAGRLLCFDAKGRPHLDTFALDSLIRTRQNVTLTYGGISKTVEIEPITGYITIQH